MLQSFLFAATAAIVSAKAVPPTTGNSWISLENGMEFQPSTVSDPVRQRALRQAQDRMLAEETQTKQTAFVDSQETYYDGYAQAWRYVGFYTDCHAAQDDHRRKLNEDEVEPCQRYLLWAAVSILPVFSVVSRCASVKF